MILTLVFTVIGINIALIMFLMWDYIEKEKRDNKEEVKDGNEQN